VWFAKKLTMGNAISTVTHVVVGRVIPLCLAVVPTHYALLWLSNPPLAYFVVCVIAVFLSLSAFFSRQENDASMFKITIGMPGSVIRLVYVPRLCMTRIVALPI